MDYKNLSSRELLRKLYSELKVEGAIDPVGVIEKYLNDGQIASLFDFEKKSTIEFDGYSKVKSEVLQRNRKELARAYNECRPFD